MMTLLSFDPQCQVARNLGVALNILEPFDTLAEDDPRRVWLLSLAAVCLNSLDAMREAYGEWRVLH